MGTRSTKVFAGLSPLCVFDAAVGMPLGANGRRALRCIAVLLALVHTSGRNNRGGCHSATAQQQNCDCIISKTTYLMITNIDLTVEVTVVHCVTIVMWHTACSLDCLSTVDCVHNRYRHRARYVAVSLVFYLCRKYLSSA